MVTASTSPSRVNASVTALRAVLRGDLGRTWGVRVADRHQVGAGQLREDARVVLAQVPHPYRRYPDRLHLVTCPMCRAAVLVQPP